MGQNYRMEPFKRRIPTGSRHLFLIRGIWFGCWCWSIRSRFGDLLTAIPVMSPDPLLYNDGGVRKVPRGGDSRPNKEDRCPHLPGHYPGIVWGEEIADARRNNHSNLRLSRR
jgi:hypothetical protein